jgi:hypothetical protein
LPWVPQAVLDELLEAQRALREALQPPAPAVPTPPVTSLGTPGVPFVPAPAPHVVELPAVVRQVCEQYAFGSAEERAANYTLAQQMHANGAPVSDIVRAIRAGGDMPALYV